MRVVHKLGYVSVIDEKNVKVYTEEEWVEKRFIFDPDLDTEEWHEDPSVEY